MNDGSVASVGSRKYGQLGNGETDNLPTSIFKYLSESAPSMKMVAAGSEHSVAIGKDGKVYLWGHNDSGLLGIDPDSVILNTPTPITSASWGTPVSVVAGYDNTVVIDDQGLVYAWGSNYHGELGNGEIAEVVDVPSRVLHTNGTSNLVLGVGSKDATYQSQITLNATIPAPTFAVSIPATLDVGSLDQKGAGDADAVKSTSFEVRASNVSNLFGEKQVVVAISAPNGEFVLRDEEFLLTYAVYDAEQDGTRLDSGDVFAVFDTNGSAKGRIEIDQSQITRRGSYSGTLIFAVSVTDKEEQ